MFFLLCVPAGAPAALSDGFNSLTRLRGSRDVPASLLEAPALLSVSRYLFVSFWLLYDPGLP
jgi:hypothetical protein